MAGAERTIGLFKSVLDSFREEIDFFGSAPTMYAGTVDSSAATSSSTTAR